MITLDEIKKISSLARINLTEKAKEKLALELSVVVDYFKKMQALDTQDVDLNLAETEVSNQTRKDEPQDSGLQKEILANAPAREEGFFKVKSVL